MNYDLKGMPTNRTAKYPAGGTVANKNQFPISFIICCYLAAFGLLPPTAYSQGTTAFTYQGQLKDNGTNANGNYTMIFKLCDAANAGNQVGGTITTTATLANGLFTLNLDFGAGAFNGSARWLDITITNSGDTQTLSPRVQILATPYAQFATLAATVTNGAIGSVQLATNSILATNIAAGQVVQSFNGLTDNVTISAGDSIWLATNANNIQINFKTNAPLAPKYVYAGNNIGFTDVGTNGDYAISASVPRIQALITNGTFTVPSNVFRIMVEMWGGGGGGGASFLHESTGPNDPRIMNNGGGGGAGAYALNTFSVTPGAQYLVTIGNGGAGGTGNGETGGTTTFGNLMSAAGGMGGTAGSAAGGGRGGYGGFSTNAVLPFEGGTGEKGSQLGGNGGGGAGASAIRGGNGGWGGWWGGSYESEGRGPGGGGGGGGYGSIGTEGAQGVVFIYY